MKIFKQIIANGFEWHPCIHCGRRFVIGEIITALSDDEGNSCGYWYCSECFDRFWFSPLPVPVERDDDIHMFVVKNGKFQACPKPMSPAEYMKREINFRSTYPGIEIRKSAMY